MIQPSQTQPPAVNQSEQVTWQDGVPTRLLGPSVIGLLTIAVFMAGFGIWALRAPLAGAAIAPGIVIASGQNQEISHLEGGIIREIVVREGEEVNSGQPLIFLDETQAQVDRNRVRQSLVSLSAQLARAVAELQSDEILNFDDELLAQSKDINSSEMLDLQRAEFDARLQQHKSELAVLDEQVLAIEQEISGINQQIEAEQRKLVVIREELAAKKTLLERGLTPKNQYNLLLRTEADSEGAIGRLGSNIGQRKNSIAEVRERQTSIKAARRTEASALINQTRTEMADLKEQLASRADVLERMIIRAPVEGVIVDISKNTVGSVVSPGEAVLEILPTSSDLIIEARVTPQDVDVVRIGQLASVRFVALNTRTTPEVPATVEYVSADRLIDQVSQEPYFDARLKLAEELPNGFERGQIYPGMPVETFIKTGERTFVEYLAKPITDSFSRAFRED